jgi:hypothetical protein
MIIEDRVAPCLHFPATASRLRPAINQERLARPYRGQPDQFDLRKAERQGQESDNREDDVVVDSRRCRAKARPRRTRAGSDRLRSTCFGGSSRNNGARSLLETQMYRASAICGGPFFTLAATPTESHKSSALPALHSRIYPLHAGPLFRPHVRGIRPCSTNVRARFPKTPGVVPRPA